MDYYEEKRLGGGKRIVIHRTVELTEPAQLAAGIAERLALVAGVPDGYDEAGRQKFRAMSPEECASRACRIAQELFGEFKARDWLLDLPNPEPRPIPSLEGEAEDMTQ